MDPLSLYLHIPFCRHRCSYCDFNTYTTIGDLKEDYVESLVCEIEEVAQLAENAGALRPVDTVFIGGGTPSLLTENQVWRLLEAVANTFTFQEHVEITLEANPETVDRDYLSALHDAGINRLSFGMQSANGGELALLGRTHDVTAVMDAVAQARSAGLDNFNLDLIYGLPDQKLGSWEQSLRVALDLEPAHLSLYCLTIEQGTPLYRSLRNGQIPAPDGDVAARQYELSCQILQEAGFEHYEISNWARPGHDCRHNLAYWRDTDYLGLGAGAHGKAAGVRYSLVRRPRTYIRRLIEGNASSYPLSAAVVDAHKLEQREAMFERVITQLRLLQEGLDLALFEQQFGQSLDDAFDGLVHQLEAWELLKREGERLFLTEQARFISNQVFYRFL